MTLRHFCRDSRHQSVAHHREKYVQRESVSQPVGCRCGLIEVWPTESPQRSNDSVFSEDFVVTARPLVRLLRVCCPSSFLFQNPLMSEFHAHLTEHSDDVWRTAYRLLNDSEDAGECFQQTFTDALKIDPATVRCWRAVLSRIATRRAMDLLRRRYRDQDSIHRLD